MWFCDPFGHTNIENLYNFGHDDRPELGYVFLHDQEPVQHEIHQFLFSEVVQRNFDIDRHQGKIIVSERGTEVERIPSTYGWSTYYYFFHGWACLDWYRGYDRNLLLIPPQQRSAPSVTFMSPNRIVGGQRDHRVLFLYHLQRLSLTHNNISAPRICPHENVDILDVASRYQSQYPDIIATLQNMDLPRTFHGEETQKMTSCWLGNFDEVHHSLIYVPTETVYFGRRTHLTEKTFKAIAQGMPFVLVAPSHSLEYLREYGFKTFGDIWDESYDLEINDHERLRKITELLRDIDGLSSREKTQIWQACLPRVQHNWDHFYRGGFETVLWNELQNMLTSLSN